jgi:hypothetical protein
LWESRGSRMPGEILAGAALNAARPGTASGSTALHIPEGSGARRLGDAERVPGGS